jgi:actin-like ATPase involved in cell morphogenesis
MGYSLGIDVGTTYTAAAVWRDGRVEVVALESHRVAIPSVVFAMGDEVAFGTAAAGKAATQPAGGAREFKRRLGDPVPIMLSGAPYSAERLVALFAQWVVRSVVEQFGEAPERVAVTHPANWTEFQLHLLSTALHQAGLEDVSLITEPQAAAIDFGAAAQLELGQLVVVYDLGGGTFDVALLRREAGGFSHVGEPAGDERLGGIDFDEAVFQYVIRNVPEQVVTDARSGQAGRMALAQLRRTCTEAKESLSSDVAVDVPVVLPRATSTVRLTRGEFEEMIRPMLSQTVALIEQVIIRNGITVADLSAVLLVGGSSRIPAVSELVRQRLGAPLRVDAHPKLVVARGAARWAGARTPTPSRAVARAPTRGRRRGFIVAAAVATTAAVGAGVWFLTAGDEGGSTASQPTDAPATSGRVETTVRATPTSRDGSTQPSDGTTTTLALPPRQTVDTIVQIGVGQLPPGVTVEGHRFEGLTGMTNVPQTDGYLALSDARIGPYEATLFEASVELSDDQVEISGASPTTLVDADGQVYSGEAIDAEGIAVLDSGSILVASEGDGTNDLDPALLEFDRDGNFQRDWTVPDWFDPDPAEVGIPPEGGLNALAVMSPAREQLVIGFEYTLKQDMKATQGSGDSARILVYDAASMEPVAEYRYPIDRTAFDWPASDGSLVKSGLLELLPLGDGRTVIALERSLKEKPITTRLYEVVLEPDEGEDPSRDGPAKTLEKRELFEFTVGGAFQSMAFGPTLDDGRRSLLVLTDHGFSDRSTVAVAYALDVKRAE